jgi:membrane fusion protein
MSLFREAATGGTSSKWLGVPAARQPTSWMLVLLMLVCFSVLTVIFLATATFARKETATGILNFSRGELRVVAARAGVVETLFVKDGQAVRSGDPLVSISTAQDLGSGEGVLDETVLRAIDREQSALEARLAALDAAAPINEAAARVRLSGIEQQITDLSPALDVLQEQRQLAEQAVDAGRAAGNQGFLRGSDVRQREYELLGHRRALIDYRSQISELQSRASEERANLQRLPADNAQQRAAIRQEIEALEERRASARAQRGFVLRAQASGLVTALQLQPGQSVDPSKPLMTLVPAESHLQAEIYVPSRAIGFIRPGDEARLMYDAFPYQRFGPAMGKVVEVPAAVMKPEEVANAVQVREPVYRVIVEIAKPTMSAYGRELPLRSGMALTADLILDRRSFLDLILDPLLASRGRILVN